MAAAAASRRWPVYLAAACLVPILVIAAALAVVASRFDSDDVARLLSAKVAEHTGRELRIEGPVSYSLAFLPRLSVEGVRLQNAPWGSRPARVKAS